MGKYAYKASDLASPKTGGKLSAGLVCAQTKEKYKKIGGIPLLLPDDLPQEMKLSIDAWNQQWARLKGAELKASQDEYYRDYMDDTLRQVLSWVDKKKHHRYLEIGCGPGFLGVEVAKRGFEVAGLDCCVEALKVAAKVYKKAGQKAFLLGGELTSIPLKKESVDFLYGGGVIEHFDDTSAALKELHRILKPGGVSFNTVPYFSLSSLSYRQKWGNIPDVPVLKQLFEFVHMRLLGGKHMVYGYEKSFTAAKMKRLHLQAGFRRVHIQRFDVFLPLYFLPEPLKPFARWLSKTRLFWPMISVVGVK